MARFTFSAFSDEAAKSLEEQIAACKAAGIGAMELRGIDGRNIATFDPAEAEEIKAKLDAAGIAVSAIGSPFGKLFIEEEFEEHFAEFKNTVAVADVLEAPVIRMFSFYFGTENDHAALKEEVVRRVSEMVKYAKKKGIQCCHENEKGIYGDTPERCLELLEAIPALGCVFDFANFMECGCDPLAAYQLLKSKITYFHIKDYCKEWKQVVPAGWGDAKIEEILADFDASTLDVVTLSLEPHLKSFDGLKDFDAETQRRLEEKSAYATRDEAFAQAAKCMREVAEKAQPVRLGIIGYGNMGSGHAGMYKMGQHKRSHVVAVADILPERLESAKQDLPGVATFSSSQALIESGLCDAVIIATPHYGHPPIAMAAFAAGLHVMSEKPAGVYTKQVREMNEAAARSGKIFAIMYNQRSNTFNRYMREAVQSGRYGELKRVVWIICDWYRTQAYYNSGGWRATWSGEGGGVLINQCPHNLDLWQWICGMPCKISATCHEGKWHDIEVEDDVTVYAEYPNGATGTFITTTAEPMGANRLEITLDKAKMICENGKITLYETGISTEEHIRTAKDGFDRPKATVTTPEIEPLPGHQHAIVLNAFSEAIVTGDRGKLFAQGEEGINGLTISNAAHLSSWLGKPVTLPLDEDLFYAELQKKVAGSKAKSSVNEAVAADITASFR
ncbi:MAG: TIM barrel protein [Oscillospiraceae bacterium]|jgi:predicted dehydrogenase/sugar phosphate isomerase/epimerase|nr:TIM barrel protein [Oscillospiraceae bacterium]